MAAGNDSTVSISINVVDANSGQVIGATVQNLGTLGDAGTKAGTQVALGAQTGATALKGVGDAGAAIGKFVGDGSAAASASLDTVTAATARVQQGMNAIPVAVEAAAKRTKTAGSEMQQMLDNIQRAQKKIEQGSQGSVQPKKAFEKTGNVLGDSFSNIGTAKGDVDNLGESFVRMGQKSTKALGDTGAHSTQALDRVRLLSQEFGLRLPRALESMIARQPAVMAAIGALGSAVAGLAIAEVFYRAGTALYDLEQKFISIKAPAEEFYKSLKKAAELDFSNVKTLSTAQARSGIADENQHKSQKQAEDLRQQSLFELNPVKGIGDFILARKAAEAAAQSKDNSQKLTGAVTDKLHEQALAQIEINHALDGTLSRRQQIAAAVAKEREIGGENKSYQRKQEGALGNFTPGDAGQQEMQGANLKSEREAAAQTIALNQEVSQAIMRSRDAAAQAGLQGEALYRRKQLDGVKELRAELVAQHMAEEIPARTRALNEQYDNERLARLRELTNETRRGTAEAALAAQKGLSRVDAEHGVSLGNIDAAEKKFSGGAPISAEAKADFQQQRVNATQTSTAQAKQLEDQFADHIRDLDNARSDSAMSAGQRIDAATRRSQQEITKAWDDTYGKLGAMDRRRVQSYQALQVELGKMTAEGVREKQENRQGIADETLRMEAEAGRRGMTREQEEAQAILDDYNERYRHLEELRGKDAENADLYRRQELAAEEIKNGKLIEQQRAMRDKLAGTIRGYLNNPLEALKKNGEEAASKYGADLLLKLERRPASAAAAPGNTGAGGVTGVLAGAMGLPGGIFHGGAGKAGEAGHNTNAAKHEVGHPATVAASSSVSAASTELRTGSATIYVQSATFASMPSGAGAALPASTIAAGGGAGDSGASAASGSSGLPNYAASSTGDLGSGGGALSAVSSTLDAGSGILGGLSSTGGPAVAAARASLGGGEAGDAGSGLPSIFSDTSGMGQQGNELGKVLGLGDLGQEAQNGLSKASGLSADTLGKAGGAVSGAAGIFSAVESNGGVGSALSGALSGAKLGGMLGGPIGAGIGAAAGAIVGFLGFGGANKAKDYDRKEVKPRIANDLRQFGEGAMDYSSAWEDLVNLDKEARTKIKAFGPGGKREWNDAIHPEIMKAQQTLTREQKAGRSKYGEAAAQFHNGGIVGDFGAMATSGDQGWIHAQRGEFMVQQQAVPSHYQALQLMQSGASHSDMASFYGAGSQGSGMMMPAPASRDTNLHFHSHDAQGALRLFMDNKHIIREAVDQSYLENSGGANA